MKSAILTKLTLAAAKDPTTASDRDWFIAAALTVRDRIVHRWAETKRRNRSENRKTIYYLSLEFLIGRMLRDVLHNLQLTTSFEAALGDLGVDIDRMFAAEPDAALGNGGLGRLAACFMDSMATLAIPAMGYGIRYDHGLFRQVIKEGEQQEYPENWLSFGNPWEFEHPEIGYDIGFGGFSETTNLSGGGARAVWHPGETVAAVAYDTPVPGWRGQAREPAPPVVRPRHRSAAPRRVQRRRPCRRADRAGARRNDLQDSLSERRHAGGPAIAAAAGIFLRLRVAAGSGAAARRRSTATSARCRTRRRSS